MSGLPVSTKNELKGIKLTHTTSPTSFAVSTKNELKVGDDNGLRNAL